MVDEDLIGIVGLGAIGGAIAQQILASGRRVQGWARNPDALTAFVAQGGEAVASPADLSHASVLISVLFDDASTREVLLGPSGPLPAMRKGSVHVAMETISPALSRELFDWHEERGQFYLAAPVFGRPDAAAKGELAIMCSGHRQAFDRTQPLLEAAGTSRWIGEQPEQAMLVKLAGNHVILSMGEVLHEAFILLAAAGVDGEQTKTALLDRLMPQVLAGYAARFAQDLASPRAAGTAVGHKDNGLLLDAADDLRVELPVARYIRDLAAYSKDASA